MKLTEVKIIAPITTIASLLLMIAWMAGAFNEKVAPGSITVDNISVTDAFTVEKRELTVYEAVPASIEAKQSTIISSRILARIKRVHVRAGDIVTQGQVLVELEQTDLQSRVSQAESTIQSVNARMIEANKAFVRAKDLTQKGLLAQADLDKAQANHDALIADLARARQSLNEAHIALSFAKVSAPIDGRIVDRFAEPGDTTQPGVPLLSLYNPSSLRVEAYVREQLALSLKDTQSLEVVIPALEKRLTSHIEELVPAGSTGSRNLLVKSRLESSHDLLPGMYAQLRIPAGLEKVLLVPVNKVASIGQLDTVRILNDGVVERRFVRTGKLYPGDMLEVVAGLVEGEQVLPIRE